VTIGSIIIRAPKSGCSRTKKDGTHTIHKKGTKPFEILPSMFLYLLQKADTAKISESLRNSVGCREKGIPGMSNHPRAPLILIQKTRTRMSNIIAPTLIILTCFFHQIYGILIARTMAKSPRQACTTFLAIKRQLFGSDRLPVSTIFLVILYESYTLTELIIIDQKITKASIEIRRG
jgi:hypothetical protein